MEISEKVEKRMSLESGNETNITPLDAPPQSPSTNAAAGNSFTEMLQQKLRFKSTPVQLLKRDEVGGGNSFLPVDKISYNVEVLRKLGRTIISTTTSWPEDIAEQYQDFARSQPDPRAPLPSKLAPSSQPRPQATPQKESFDANKSIASASRGNKASTGTPFSASTDIPPFECRIQACKKRGFLILHKPAPSTDCLYVYQHRKAYKNLAEVKVMGSWKVRELRKEASRSNAGVDEWVVTSTESGGTGMIKWIDTSDDVLCSFTLRVQGRMFVLNSEVSGSWGKEELVKIPDIPRHGHGNHGGKPDSEWGRGGQHAFNSNQKSGHDSGASFFDSDAEPAPLWDSEGLESESATAAKQRKIFDEERRQFEAEREKMRAVGGPSSGIQGSYHASSDELLNALIEEDAMFGDEELSESHENDDVKVDAVEGGGLGPGARKVSIQSLFGAQTGPPAKPPSTLSSATVSTAIGPVHTVPPTGLAQILGATSLSGNAPKSAFSTGHEANMNTVFGTSLFSAPIPSTMTSSGDMDALFDDLAPLGALGNGGSWLSLDNTVFGSSAHNLTNTNTSTSTSTMNLQSHVVMEHVTASDDDDIDLNILAIPSWSPDRASWGDVVEAQPPVVPKSPPQTEEASARPVSLSALFDAAKLQGGTGVVGRDGQGQISQNGSSPDAVPVSACSFNVLSKLGFQENGAAPTSTASPAAPSSTPNTKSAPPEQSPSTPASSFAFHQESRASGSSGIKNMAAGSKRTPNMSAAAKLQLMQRQLASTKSPTTAASSDSSNTSTLTQPGGGGATSPGMKKIALSQLFGAGAGASGSKASN